MPQQALVTRLAWCEVVRRDGRIGVASYFGGANLGKPGEIIHGVHCASNDDALSFVFLVEGVVEV